MKICHHYTTTSEVYFYWCIEQMSDSDYYRKTNYWLITMQHTPISIYYYVAHSYFYLTTNYIYIRLSKHEAEHCTPHVKRSITMTPFYHYETQTEF